MDAAQLGTAQIDAGQAAPQRQGRRLSLTWEVPQVVGFGGQVERRYVAREATLDLSPPTLAALQDGTLTALRPRLNALYRQIEAQRPRDARFVQAGRGWEIQAQPGLLVDRRQTETALKRALAGGGERVPLVLKLVAPTRPVAWLQGKGLVHLGSGETTFTGSPEFRVHNIVTGAAALDGVWVVPYQAFDFNRLLRPARLSGAFRPGYVISGGGLATEDGGGICQVSTTVFRAALQAGLPILERHPHSHQVAYYGQPGLDAAVYAPVKNLRFRNSGRLSLLVQTEWDVGREVLRVHLFGAPPVWQVSVLPPQQTDVRPALAPQFLLDRGLKRGEAVRIDMPSVGSSVKVIRELRDAQGRVVRREVFRSRYAPWGGAFAVGPGDPRLRGR